MIVTIENDHEEEAIDSSEFNEMHNFIVSIIRAIYRLKECESS